MSCQLAKISIIQSFVVFLNLSTYIIIESIQDLNFSSMFQTKILFWTQCECSNITNRKVLIIRVVSLRTNSKISLTILKVIWFHNIKLALKLFCQVSSKRKWGINTLWERPLMTSRVFWPFLTYLSALSYSITSDLGGYLELPTYPKIGRH